MGSKQYRQKDAISEQEEYLINIQRKISDRDEDRILFIKNVLKRSPKVIDSTYKGSTILHLAVCKNDFEVVTFLLGKMDIKTIQAVNSESKSALDMALDWRHIEMFELLKSHDTFSDTFIPALSKVIKQGDIQNLRHLCAEGMDVNFVDQSGISPLHTALNEGITEIIKLLLDYGADVNFVDQSGISPLHTALNEGITEIIKLLLDYGADVNFVDRSGIHPLHAAVNKRGTDMVKLLLYYRADVNFVDRSGIHPLHAAVNKGLTDIVKLLLCYGADVNVKDQFGISLLQKVVINGDYELVEMIAKTTNIDTIHSLLEWVKTEEPDPEMLEVLFSALNLSKTFMLRSVLSDDGYPLLDNDCVGEIVNILKERKICSDSDLERFIHDCLNQNTVVIAGTNLLLKNSNQRMICLNTKKIKNTVEDDLVVIKLYNLTRILGIEMTFETSNTWNHSDVETIGDNDLG